MARPLLPPKFVTVPADIVYDVSLPAGVFRTFVQLRGLLWGKEEESQDFTIKELMEVTGLSRSALYGHLGILRSSGWLLSSSTHYSRITIYLHGGAQAAEETVDKTVDKYVEKSVDNLSRNLDSSIKEDVKDIEHQDQCVNLPPDNLVKPREKVVQKSGQVSKNLDKNNGWHDVIDKPLEEKLERLGVFPQVYGQVAEAVRSGKWTLEQVKELAGDVLDLGDSAGPGVFVFRLKNRIRQESPAERQEKELEKFRKYYREQKLKEAEHGA